MPRHLREYSLPDQLEKLFSRLVENLRALDAGAVHRPIRIVEIPGRLVPYRTHRVLLGFDTNEDYEMTLLRLLAGERGYVQVFPEEAAKAFAAEAESINPNTGLYRKYPEATAVLNAEAPGEVEQEPGAAERVELEAEPESVLQVDDTDDEDAAPPLPFVLEEAEDSRVQAQPREIVSSAPCPYCGAGLPVGRTVLFCPHCGQNIGVVHCPTCGSELDVGWQFCIACGQKVTGLG